MPSPPSPPSTPHRSTRPTHPYPTPPSTSHLVSHKRRPSFSIPSEDPPSPTPACLVTLGSTINSPDNATEDEVYASEFGEIKLPRLIYDAEIPEAPPFEPFTYAVPNESSPTLTLQGESALGQSKQGKRMELDGDTAVIGEEEDELQRLIIATDGILPSEMLQRNGLIPLRPSVVLADAWWIRSGFKKDDCGLTVSSRSPLFFPSGGPVDTATRDLCHRHKQDRQSGAMFRPTQEVTKREDPGQADQDVVYLRASLKPSTAMIPIDIAQDDSALEHYFDEHIDLNSSSSSRGKTGACENSAMAEDFEITGISFPAGSSSSNHKRRRIEHDPRNSPDRSASSSPLNEVEACVKCGCTCAGIYRTKGKEGVEIEMSGTGKKGRWGGLSKDVSANILAALLGGENESLRTKAGNSVTNWPDLARKVGARGGQHDTVRRVAKDMQRKLPLMMKKGML